MGAKSVVIEFPSGNAAKILKWKVEEGSLVNVGRVILLYDLNLNNGQTEGRKLKSTQVGTVRKLLAKEGEMVSPGAALLELEECTHPTVFKDMCAECGVDLRKDDQSLPNASVPMVHSIPELKVSEAQAQILGKADEERLLHHRKLVLLVDLDQTLIHTTNDNIPANLKDVYHFQLYGPSSPWYHTRLRPGTHKFLGEMSRYFELHICTFGARNYAHMIAMFLDPDGKFFSHRILSRDECFDPNSKTANLKALFPRGDHMVCIIDDREDVWNYASNLIHVKPYHFFKHTGDINAPPGLAKQENDEKEGFDFDLAEEKLHSKLEGGKSEENDKEDDEMRETIGDENKIETEIINEDSAQDDTTNSNGKKVELSSEEETDEVKLKLSHSVDETISDTKPQIDPLSESKLELQSNNDQVDSPLNLDSTSSDKIDLPQDLNLKSSEIKQLDPSFDASNCESVDIPPTDVDDSKLLLSNSVEEAPSAEVKSAECDLPTPVEVIECEAASIKGEEELVELEDDDDYLLYLEEILKKIHTAYFQCWDELKGTEAPDMKDIIPDAPPMKNIIPEAPDMKDIIPEVRSKVLSGTQLVFSGLVPTHVTLEESKAYLVAVSLGADVTQDIEPNTTHLVAVRSGTSKVNAARRLQGVVKVVTPKWLWSCAERWEHTDERLFPLGKEDATYRHPPAHCTSPPHVSAAHGPPAVRQRTPSGRFMDSINPLMTLSTEDIANMDQEVEDMFNESDESEGEGKATAQAEEAQEKPRVVDECEEATSSSTGSYGEGEDVPHGWELKRKKKDGESDEEMPSAKFRRGEALDDDDVDVDNVDVDDDSEGSVDYPDELEEEDDGDWNMMGAALEREFLGNGD